MDDHLQRTEARREGHEDREHAATEDQDLAAAFSSESQSCSLYKIKPTSDSPSGTPFPDAGDLASSTDEDAMGEAAEYTAVLLRDGRRKSTCETVCPSCYSLLKSYRSADPTTGVTPFAVVLLGVLFLVYILNQADRLVLPVVIPAGLRCDLPGNDKCSENDSSASGDGSGSGNGTGDDDEDCINFSDYQQGLLTGAGN